ncbi:MAG: ATP-dependent zinc metalloprotease FtsH [Lachnospiraceae bacterium]|nr:ATP-dependent zinc metalloprotease FtsH [Lachnospiraceae bacterium]
MALIWSRMQNGARTPINHEMFESYLASGEIAEVTIIQNAEVPTGEVMLQLKSGVTAYMYTSDVNEVVKELDKKFPTYTLEDVKREGWFASYVLPSLIIVVLMIVFFTYMNGSAGGGSRMMNFGKSHAKLSSGDNKMKFTDVAGLDEEKEDLEEIVDFLKNARKYVEVGARIPKGVILVGPPGTGKTLLAKAIAGEAGVPFFSISGSDFVEMFVGVGASRVRDLFEEAKKNAPCIVFIDEIDAVARRRGTGMGGGHDEREQTLNQLLVEMDGFGVNEGIIVLAATNRVDILDPAIMRPGRFDRKVAVGTPDVKGRREILDVHSKNKPLADDVDLDEISKSTAGFTGADLENLMNEAAIRAAKTDRKFIKMSDIRESFLKVGVGAEKRSKVVSDREKRITAFHESGHAILHYILPDIDPVNTVSIIPTGLGAGGYTMSMPEEDVMFETRGRMLNQIVAILGGRAAESIVLDDITTGASSDIKTATHIAKNMVTRYGMSENIGAICYDDEGDEVFIGKDLAHARAHSEAMASRIDEEVKYIIDTCYEKAVKLINENRDKLDACAQLLLEKEKINRAEFEALFGDADTGRDDEEGVDIAD